MHEVRELDGVADEENRQVDANYVPVALLRVELDCKTAWVTRLFRRSAIAHHGREANEHGGRGDRLEHLCGGQRAEVSCRHELAKGTGTARVYDTLRDPFAIKTLQLFNQMRILQKDWTFRAGSLRILIVADGRSVVSRQVRCERAMSDSGRREHRKNAYGDFGFAIFQSGLLI